MDENYSDRRKVTTENGASHSLLSRMLDAAKVQNSGEPRAKDMRLSKSQVNVQ